MNAPNKTARWSFMPPLASHNSRHMSTLELSAETQSLVETFQTSSSATLEIVLMTVNVTCSDRPETTLEVTSFTLM